MTTLACWFSDERQARQAVLDLLTGGIPRDQISAVVRAPDDGEAADAPDFVAALIDPVSRSPADTGPVLVSGPLGMALADAGLGDALARAGVPADEARAQSQALRGGGALVAVQASGVHGEVVVGVFRHSANPELRAQEEHVGPRSLDELAGAPEAGPISTSIGAMTGGLVPGGWGAAAAAFEDLPDQPDTEERRRKAEL